jgi:hypothetical protein
MIDLCCTPKEVEIKIDRVASGWALWVNVDGKCQLRIYELPFHSVTIEDKREED